MLLTAREATDSGGGGFEEPVKTQIEITELN